MFISGCSVTAKHSADSHAVLAFLDMTAAFETVDHGILLQRLQRSHANSYTLVHNSCVLFAQLCSVSSNKIVGPTVV